MFWKDKPKHICFDLDLVVSSNISKFSKIKISSWDGENTYYLPFDNETYSTYTSVNLDFDTEILRYG